MAKATVIDIALSFRSQLQDFSKRNMSVRSRRLTVGNTLEIFEKHRQPEFQTLT